MDIELLIKKGVLLGLIDKTYQIETLYGKGDIQQGTFVLKSLREGLQELSEDLEKQD